MVLRKRRKSLCLGLIRRLGFLTTKLFFLLMDEANVSLVKHLLPFLPLLHARDGESGSRRRRND